MRQGRRLFIGDLHGCLEELNGLLNEFSFRPGLDTLFSVGDVVGKGPFVEGTVRRLRELEARVVMGNHDRYLLKAAALPAPERKPKQQEYVDLLGGDPAGLIAYMSAWPAYIELTDIILVHAGLQPGVARLEDMDPRVLQEIRTWDGKGEDLNRTGDPPWFECVQPGKTVVFGHWAQRGLVDRRGFKGLDTGCVYGGKLTGWSPEAGGFIQFPARRAYATIPGGR